MRIGLFGNRAYSVAGAGPFDVDGLIAEAASAAADGLASYWVGQQFDWDAFSLLAAIGREVPDIELGTNVTHIWTAFPVHLAQQAVSLDVLTGGRFTLGLGVEHEWVTRDMWGLPFERPVTVLEEYLEVVDSLLKTGAVDFEGDHYRVKTFFARFAPTPEMPVVLGALGPRMLALAGRRADGTSTWLTGVRTIRDHIVPKITDAAAAAGRRPPRIIANMPIVVTTRAEADVRQEVAAAMDMYHQMPSYQAMLAREGMKSAGDIAIVGPRGRVIEQLHELAAAGATDLGAIVFGDAGEEEATRDVLRSVAAA